MHPFLVRQIVFPLQERLKRKNTYSILAEIEKSQWLTPEQIRELQLRRLGEYLAFAYAHSVYYRQALDEQGFDSSRIRDFADLKALPFLTKDILRDRFEELRSNVPLPGVQKMSTGGSTGAPVAVLIDAERSAFTDAARLRAHRWFDADIGVREIVLWGSPIEITRQDYIRLIRDRLLNSRLLSAFNLGEEKLAEYSDALIRYRPVKMYGYASALYLLARYFQETGRKPPDSLKVIFTTAEPLFDFQRTAISQAFNCEVAVEYGARDAGLMANECPRGGLHIPAEGMILEIKQPDTEGKGEIVITNLFAKAMPIIRYRTGDVGRLTAGPCSCGRGLPVLEKIEGRQTDFIVTPEGRVLHALAVIYVLRECPEITKFQVLQETTHRLIVKVVSRGDLGGATREEIIAKLRKVVGEAMLIEITCVADIPVTASGKFRYVISNVKLPQLAA
jgi:phenylacetate-CoA ligase